MHIRLNGINIHIQADLFPLLLFSGGVLLSRALSNAVRDRFALCWLCWGTVGIRQKKESKGAFPRLFWFGLDSKVIFWERTNKSEPLTTQFRDHSGGLVSFLANGRQGCVEDRSGRNLLPPSLLGLLKQPAVLLAHFQVNHCYQDRKADRATNINYHLWLLA